jgi:hypothetical protein
MFKRTATIAATVSLALGTTVALASPALANGEQSAVRTAPASSGTLSKPPRGAVRTSAPCRLGTYKEHPKLVTAHRQPAVTHISTYGIGPTVSHKVTREADHATTVNSGWHLAGSADIATKGFASLIAKVDVHFDGNYKKSSGHTARGSVSVTDTVANRTSHNVQYVFYSGVTHAYGAVRWYFCEHYYVDGQNYGPNLVTYYPGTWTSYAVPGSGALSCSGGSRGLGALAKRALQIGCTN